ncbi:MAG: hypothetical protein PHN69_08110 [Candidatus Pacebacteria bacterium]|nr:hypothetical protein [Candidatus Paceibacterota bacterium]
MNGVLIPRKLKKHIDKIYQHPEDVYSIVLKCGETIWCNDKVDLYKRLHGLVIEN